MQITLGIEKKYPHCGKVFSYQESKIYNFTININTWFENIKKKDICCEECYLKNKILKGVKNENSLLRDLLQEVKQRGN